jgi:hypothetical protein
MSPCTRRCEAGQRVLLYANCRRALHRSLEWFALHQYTCVCTAYDTNGVTGLMKIVCDVYRSRKATNNQRPMTANNARRAAIDEPRAVRNRDRTAREGIRGFLSWTRRGGVRMTSLNGTRFIRVYPGYPRSMPRRGDTTSAWLATRLITAVPERRIRRTGRRDPSFCNWAHDYALRVVLRCIVPYPGSSAVRHKPQASSLAPIQRNSLR